MWADFEGLFSFWQYFEPTLKLFIVLFKEPNIEQKYIHLVNTVSRRVTDQMDS